MTVGECLERFGISPTVDDAAEIRQILATQTDLESKSQGDGELMKLNCVQLFAIGDVSDSMAIWAAKRSSFDKGAYIDVQLLCGAGLEETLRYLDGIGSESSQAAATYIRDCVTAGDFEAFSPEQHVAQYRNYFGV